MKHVLFVVVALGLVAACSNKPKELRSPCVGIEGSPCEKRPANSNHHG